jgi:hypothetical protein
MNIAVSAGFIERTNGLKINGQETRVPSTHIHGNIELVQG